MQRQFEWAHGKRGRRAWITSISWESTTSRTNKAQITDKKKAIWNTLEISFSVLGSSERHNTESEKSPVALLQFLIWALSKISCIHSLGIQRVFLPRMTDLHTEKSNPNYRKPVVDKASEIYPIPNSVQDQGYCWLTEPDQAFNQGFDLHHSFYQFNLHWVASHVTKHERGVE